MSLFKLSFAQLFGYEQMSLFKLSFAQLFGYEQMSLFMLSLAQLFGYEQMNLFMLSLARKFGLHENSGYRLQWLVISEWFQQAPRSVCTMLKAGFSASTMFREGRPLWGQKKIA